MRKKLVKMIMLFFGQTYWKASYFCSIKYRDLLWSNEQQWVLVDIARWYT